MTELDEKKINKLVRLLELDTKVNVVDIDPKNRDQETIKQFLSDLEIEPGPYDVQSEKLYRLFRKWFSGDCAPTKTMFGRFIGKIFPRIRLSKGKFYKLNIRIPND